MSKFFNFQFHLFLKRTLTFESATTNFTDIRVHLDCKENHGVGYDVGDKVDDFLMKNLSWWWQNHYVGDFFRIHSQSYFQYDTNINCLQHSSPTLMKSVTTMLLTTFCWWLHDGYISKISIEKTICWEFFNAKKSVIISNLSPTQSVFKICRRHRCNRCSPVQVKMIYNSWYMQLFSMMPIHLWKTYAYKNCSFATS